MFRHICPMHIMYIKRYGRWVLVDFDLCAWQPESQKGFLMAPNQRL
jgi:hypothetical protein